MEEEFYRFGSKLLGVTLQVGAINLPGRIDENGMRDFQRLITGDYSGITFPVIFRQEMGKRIDDLIDTGYPGLYLISDKVVEVLKENKLTGWQLYGCEIFDKKGNEIEGYHGLSVLGRSGEIRYDLAIPFDMQHPNGPVTRYYKGQPIVPSTWDGSDFFLPKGYKGPCVSAKAMQILKEAKITNLRLIALSEIETPHFGLPKYWREIL